LPPVSPQAESPLPKEPGRQQWWQVPTLRTDEDRDQERKVTWLDLFFDLVFVVAIAQLAHELAITISLTGVTTFALLFVAVWLIWVGATFYNERFETEGLEQRLLFFVLMLPMAGLAVYTPDGLGATYEGFAIAYAVARAVTTIAWARAGYHVPRFRPVAIRLVSGFLLSIAMVLVSVALDGSWRLVVFISALLVDAGTPILTTRHNEALPSFSSRKLPERFGLLTIIVLGESIVGTVAGIARQADPAVASAVAGALGIALGFGLWWIYFDFVARRPPKDSAAWTFAWAYLHLPLMMAIAGVGASVLGVVSRAEDAVPDDARLLLSGSVAIALLAIAALERTLSRKADEPTHSGISPALKIGGAATALILVPLGSGIPALWFLGLMLFPLLVQMGYGAWVWYRGD
jgi:low temperature requirement protein LtrA